LIVSKKSKFLQDVHRLLYVTENQVEHVLDIGDVFEALERKTIDGVILDLPYPKEKDVKACQEIKSRSANIKVLVLSMDTTTETRVSIMKAGCDIFIADPPTMFIEKISEYRALLGIRDSVGKDEIKIAPDIIFDVKGWKIICRGDIKKLPEKEYRMLYLFATYPGQVFTTDQLLEIIWDERTEKERVRNYVKKIRRKIGDNGKNPRILMHEHGVGYYLQKYQ
jgi:DNA-binding response OmpR family regulator